MLRESRERDGEERHLDPRPAFYPVCANNLDTSREEASPGWFEKEPAQAKDGENMGLYTAGEWYLVDRTGVAKGSSVRTACSPGRCEAHDDGVRSS